MSSNGKRFTKVERPSSLSSSANLLRAQFFLERRVKWYLNILLILLESTSHTGSSRSHLSESTNTSLLLDVSLSLMYSLTVERFVSDLFSSKERTRKPLRSLTRKKFLSHSTL
jgi:hypothetical protein